MPTFPAAPLTPAPTTPMASGPAGTAPTIPNELNALVPLLTTSKIVPELLPEMTVVWGMGRKTVLGFANCAEVETPATASPKAPMLNAPKSRRRVLGRIIGLQEMKHHGLVRGRSGGAQGRPY